MSNSPATPEMTNESPDTAVSLTSLVKFQSAIAEYRFCSESPALRRSARELKVCKVNNPSTLEYEEGEEQVNTRQISQSRNKKRKRGEQETATKQRMNKKPKRGYAEPERYAHLNGLPDILWYELDVLFCGINPGEYSASVGHHFANPRNHFWRCLFESSLTEKYIPPSEDHIVPSLKPFSLGLINLVDRPTAEQSELSDAELMGGVPTLLAKVSKYRPHVVCFVGLGIAKMVKIHCLPGMKGRRTASTGFQPYKLMHAKTSDSDVCETLFYAMPSTSARVVRFQKEDKLRIMKGLRDGLIDVKQKTFDTSKMYPVRVEMLIK